MGLTVFTLPKRFWAVFTCSTYPFIFDYAASAVPWSCICAVRAGLQPHLDSVEGKTCEDVCSPGNTSTQCVHCAFREGWPHSTNRSRQSAKSGWCAHSDRFLEVTANGVSLILDLLCSSFAGGHSSICGQSACVRTKQERAAGIDGKVAVAEADSRAQGAMLGRSNTVNR